MIEDKLVADKDLASFERVLATKVDRRGRAGRRELRPEALRFLVFFGSVSGRFGNRGQADYAAASEVLNKLAQRPRPPLGRPRRLDQLGPVADDRHGVARGPARSSPSAASS